MAEISVIVPVYKVETYLLRCVDSVLHQSFQNFELILIDDGSPDHCPAMCDAYAREDHRIHVIHQKNGGLSAARNAGIDYVMERSSSTYITFLDSDDWIHRDFLKRLYEGACQYHAGIAACGYAHVAEKQEDPNLGTAQYLVMTGEKAYAEHYGKCMTACCKLIRRELLKNLRFPLQKLHEDAFITHELVLTPEPAVILDENLYYYYENPDSITRTTWSPGRLDELEGHRIRLTFLREHGYHEAEKTERITIAGTIYEQIEVLEASRNPEFKPWLLKLQKELKKAMEEAKGLIPLNRETIWLYLAAKNWMPLWRMGKKAQNFWHNRRKME